MSARAAAVGIGYQLWLRSRWLLLASLAGTLVLGIAVHLIASPVAATVVALLGSLPIAFCAAMLVGIVAYSGDMSAPESGFPRHMMVLPLSNQAMALTPLLYGATCVVALWVIVGRFVLAPGGWPVPILWPAAMLAALTVWLQATSWMPFWFPFARLAACVASLFAICAFVCAAQIFRFSDGVTAGTLVAASVLGMTIAVQGVARARRGAGTMPRWIALPVLSRKAAADGRAFSSPGRAQLWLELRRNCSLLLILILPMPLLTLLAWFWPAHRSPPAPLYIGGYIVPVQVLWAGVCLLMPPFIAGAVGGEVGKLDAWGRKQSKMSSFVAVRPMTDLGLLAAKLKASALTVGGIWILTLAMLLTAWALPHSFSRTESLMHVLIAHATPRRTAIAAALLAFLILHTWLKVIESFAVSLFGRTWLLNAVQFSVIGLFVLVCGLGAWTRLHPQLISAVLRGAVVAAWVLVAAKVGLAGVIVRAARRCRIVSSQQLISWTVGWMFLLAAHLAAVLWLAPRTRHSVAALAAGLVLLLPYNRLIAMPLAWHHNRHRS